MLEQRGLDRAREKRQGRCPFLVGPAARVVVERPELAHLLGLHVVRDQVGAVERPAGIADPGTDLEVDRVERAGGPALVAGREPMPARPAERPHPRLMRPMDRVADTLASVQSLRAAFRVPAAALQQPDLGAVADQLAGDADPGRPGPDDADVRLDLLVVGQLPRVRQHPGAPPYPQHFGGLAGVARLAVRPGLLSCVDFQ